MAKKDKGPWPSLTEAEEDVLMLSMCAIESVIKDKELAENLIGMMHTILDDWQAVRDIPDGKPGEGH